MEKMKYRVQVKDDIREYEEGTSFETIAKDFQEKYPIFDFGENHASKSVYKNDSFVKGLTEKRI